MNCRGCDLPIEFSLLTHLPLCEKCVSAAVAELAEPEDAPAYDAVRDVLTEADLWE